jgi:uncharacterized protein (TIGR01777 family)
MWCVFYHFHQEERAIRSVNKGPHSAGTLLSGASGMLGAALRGSLEVRRAELLQLVRGEPAQAGQLRWNPLAARPLADPAALEGLQTAIHFSGANVAAHRWTADYKREIWTSRVDSTRALSTMLAGLREPPKTLLVASATGIYGDRRDEILDERSSPGNGFLAELCQAWEEAAQPAVQAGIRVVNLRFGVVLCTSGALAKMLPVFRLGLGGRIGSGEQWMSWISLTDALQTTLFALDTPALAGPLNITAPQPVTNADFTRALAAALHRPAFFPAPAFAIRLALGEMADEALLSSQRAVPAKLISAGFRFAHPTVDAAIAATIASRS